MRDAPLLSFTDNWRVYTGELWSVFPELDSNSISMVSGSLSCECLL